MSENSLRENAAHPVSRVANRIFIDGQAGTVGLCIRQRLSEMPGISLVEIPDDLRKNEEARMECLRRADVAVLCLPDPAAVATIEMLADLGSDAP
jgi:N-acetyl-gamma-glutamyl-phosphate reductase